MFLKVTFLLLTFASTGIAAQSGASDGVSNVNYEKVDCHCPSCVAAHPSWAISCGSSAKVGREAATTEADPGSTKKTNKAQN